MRLEAASLWASRICVYCLCRVLTLEYQVPWLSYAVCGEAQDVDRAIKDAHYNGTALFGGEADGEDGDGAEHGGAVLYRDYVVSPKRQERDAQYVMEVEASQVASNFWQVCVVWCGVVWLGLGFGLGVWFTPVVWFSTVQGIL